MMACSHAGCDVDPAQSCSTPNCKGFGCHMCTYRVDSDRAENFQSWRICAQCAPTNPIEVISVFRAPYYNTPYCRKKRLLSTPHAVTLTARWTRRNPVPPRIARALGAVSVHVKPIQLSSINWIHGGYVHLARICVRIPQRSSPFLNIISYTPHSVLSAIHFMLLIVLTPYCTINEFQAK